MLIVLDGVQRVSVSLGAPPEVVNAGVGVHGTTSRRDIFQLPDLWQMHLYHYRAEVVVEGVAHAIRPGHVSLVPPGAVVKYIYGGRSEHLYAHLRPRSAPPTVSIPVMQDAGTQAPVLSALMHQATGAFASAPAQAVAQIWAALWQVAHLAVSTERNRPHAAIATAVAYIESNLAGPLTVPSVARAAGVSHNHLTRLFQGELGSTVVGYIRRRRLGRAEHLLRASTLPIAAVAASVGIPDLHAFNKACRQILGASPRAIRAGAWHRGP